MACANTFILNMTHHSTQYKRNLKSKVLMLKWPGLKCLHSLFTTALTHSNVVKELSEVDWGTLRYSILELPPSERKGIEGMYASEEERKSAGVMYWMDHHPYASWRLLIARLDSKREHSLANRIYQYAEKVTGMLSSILYCH